MGYCCGAGNWVVLPRNGFWNRSMKGDAAFYEVR